MRPLALVVDHEAWAKARRADTEPALRFHGELITRVDHAVITADLGDGTYKVQCGNRAFPYDSVAPIDPLSRFSVGDPVLIGFKANQPGLPVIISPGHKVIQGSPDASPAELLDGLWVQGAADEAADFSNFSYWKSGGKWIPYSSGGSQPQVISGSGLFQPTGEQPNGVIVFHAADKSVFAAWLTRERIEGDSAHSTLTLQLLPNLVWTHTNIAVDVVSTKASDDSGLNCGFLFADRSSGYVWVLNDTTVYIVDPLAQLVLCKANLGYSLHQCSVGFGYLAKMSQVPSGRDPAAYPNDRSQQDNLWRFWKYDALNQNGPTLKALAALDPQTLLPDYQLAYTQARRADLYLGDAEEGRCPIIASTTDPRVVTWLSGWEIPTGNLRDRWMNLGFGEGAYAISQASLTSRPPDLTGGHRVNDALIAWVSLSDPSKYDITRLPTNTPSPVRDNASIDAYRNWYAGMSYSDLTTEIGLNSASGVVGQSRVITDTSDVFTPGTRTDSSQNNTFAGIAEDGALNLGVTYSIVPGGIHSYGVDSEGVPFDNIEVNAVREMTYPAIATPDSLLATTALTAVDGVWHTVALRYPDYYNFIGGHQMLLPNSQADPTGETSGDENNLVIWPVNASDAFLCADPIDGIAVDSKGTAWAAYMEPWVSLEGDGDLIGVVQGVWDYDTATYLSTAGGGTYHEDVTLRSPFYSIYQCLRPRQYGHTWLTSVTRPKKDPVTGIVTPGETTRMDISNYLDHFSPAPGGTVRSSLQKAPLDSTLWKPILIEFDGSSAGLTNLNLVLLIRKMRDALYPGDLGTENQAYVSVEVRSMDDLSSLQVIKMPQNLATVALAADEEHDVPASTVRKWDFFQGYPVLVKSSADSSGSGLPVLNIFLKGIQNLPDRTTVEVHRLWQFCWDGIDPLPTASITDYPADGNHPAEFEEIGSVAFYGSSMLWSSKTGTPWGYPFGLMRQELA